MTEVQDGQRVSILTIVEGTRIKVRSQGLCEALFVGIDVRLGGHIIKGDFPSLIVQEDSNNLRRFLNVEYYRWIYNILVDITFIQAQCPEPTIWGHCDFSLSADRIFTNA